MARCGAGPPASSRSLTPWRRREARLARGELFRPDDDPLAVLPLEDHHLVRDLQAVRVHLEGAEDGVEVQLQDRVPDLLPVHGAGSLDGFGQHLAYPVA